MGTTTPPSVSFGSEHGLLRPEVTVHAETINTELARVSQYFMVVNLRVGLGRRERYHSQARRRG
jgi:hypothetical protein